MKNRDANQVAADNVTKVESGDSKTGSLVALMEHRTANNAMHRQQSIALQNSSCAQVIEIAGTNKNVWRCFGTKRPQVQILSPRLGAIATYDKSAVASFASGLHSGLHGAPDRGDSERASTSLATPRLRRTTTLVDGVECFRCSKCNHIGPRGDFHNLSNPKSRCGISSWCRRCANAQRVKRKQSVRDAARAAGGVA